jgi:hypothetical protein
MQQHKIDLNGNGHYLRVDTVRDFLLKVNGFVTTANLEDFVSYAIKVEDEISYTERLYGIGVSQECNLCYLNLRRAKLHQMMRQLDSIDMYVMEEFNKDLLSSQIAKG